VLQNILFEAYEGVLVVAASNSAQYARVSIDSLKMTDGGSWMLPGKPLVSWVSALGDVEISVISNERNIKLKAGESDVQFMTAFGSDFPQSPRFDDGSIITQRIVGVDFDTLKQMVKGTRFSILDDDNRPQLHSLLFEVTGDSLIMAGCDSFRVTEYKIPNPVAFQGSGDEGDDHGHTAEMMMPESAQTERGRRFVVPPEVFASVDRVSYKGPMDVAAGPGDIIFKIGTAEIGTKLVNELYPNYSAIWKKYPYEFKFTRGDLLSAMRRIGVVMDKEDSPMAIDFAPGKCATLFGRGEYGDVKESIPIMFFSQGCPDCHIQTNFKYLQEAVMFCGDTVVFGYTSEKNALIVLSEGVAGWKSAILPMYHGAV
jgi:DNA polymerase III sliding clamp (beta) subunit (PCNA family)